MLVRDIASEIPDQTPLLQSTRNWIQMFQGKNPVDEFRGRPIIPQKEWEAGGTAATWAMGTWQLRQFGQLSELWLRIIGDEVRGKMAGGDAWVQSIPGLNRLVRYSDRGVIEMQQAEKEAERKIMAQAELGVTTSVDRMKAARWRNIDRNWEKATEGQKKWYRENTSWMGEYEQKVEKARDEAEAQTAK